MGALGRAFESPLRSWNKSVSFRAWIPFQPFARWNKRGQRRPFYIRAGGIPL